MLHQVSQKIDDLHIQENKLEGRKREIHDSTSQIKHELTTQFEELRQRIDFKEREVLNKLDEMCLRDQN